MKKALSLILALVLCLGLCACGGAEDTQLKADAEKYAEYESLIKLIEDGDFAGAYSDFLGRFPAQENNNTDSTEPSTPGLVLDGIVVGTPDTETTVTGVEITMDNWQEYFEIVPSEKWETNAFGEAEYLQVSQAFRVKDAYKDRLTYNFGAGASMSKIDVEIGYNATYYSVTIDLENQTYTKGSLNALNNNLWGGAQTAIHTFYFNPSQTSWSCLLHPIYPGNDSTIVEWDSIEVLRIQGTLYLKDE